MPRRAELAGTDTALPLLMTWLVSHQGMLRGTRRLLPEMETRTHFFSRSTHLSLYLYSPVLATRNKYLRDISTCSGRFLASVAEKHGSHKGDIAACTKGTITTTPKALNERGGGGKGEDSRNAGDPRENPPTSGIARHDSHPRKLGATPPGSEPGSPWWEANSLTTTSPRPRNHGERGTGNTHSYTAYFISVRNVNHPASDTTLLSFLCSRLLGGPQHCWEIHMLL
ncbi:hypothetical protein PR048_008475 [Dryococelus australis]|uniref:Uncharacterized protein n=1 Tax=Dryococelus australis TaxID=614101 RepID=A0ABQ9HY05_9NEOP|nr:hypothetical protein PR048_008475 [Dryococelus australis]